MNQENINLFRKYTPAEILLLSMPANFEILQLIKLTLLDLIIKDLLIIDIKRALYTDSGESFFIKLNLGNSSIEDLSGYENVIINKLKKNKWTSLIELSKRMSFYVNEKFRFFSKGYKFENYVMDSLIEKGLLKRRKKNLVKLRIFLGFSIFTDEGLKLKNILCSELNIQNVLSGNPVKFFMFAFPDQIQNKNIKMIEEFNHEFDKFVSTSIVRSNYAPAIAEVGRNYPEPID
jgi:hypothetical protein